jgi:hypothetical protein
MKIVCKTNWKFWCERNDSRTAGRRLLKRDSPEQLFLVKHVGPVVAERSALVAHWTTVAFGEHPEKGTSKSKRNAE